VRHFGHGVRFHFGDHSIFRLSRYITLRVDGCGTALYVVYVVIARSFVMR
jgi:hypothetical protein